MLPPVLFIVFTLSEGTCSTFHSPPSATHFREALVKVPLLRKKELTKYALVLLLSVACVCMLFSARCRSDERDERRPRVQVPGLRQKLHVPLDAVAPLPLRVLRDAGRAAVRVSRVSGAIQAQRAAHAPPATGARCRAESDGQAARQESGARRRTRHRTVAGQSGSHATNEQQKKSSSMNLSHLNIGALRHPESSTSFPFQSRNLLSAINSESQE